MASTIRLRRRLPLLALALVALLLGRLQAAEECAADADAPEQLAREEPYAPGALDVRCGPEPPSPVGLEMVPVHGLMLTRGDGAVLLEWLVEHMWMLSSLVILDGNVDARQESVPYLEMFGSICPGRFKDIHWVHEHMPYVQNLLPRNFTSDQLLRKMMMEMLRGRSKTRDDQAWVLLAHPDEFLYHDPRKVAAAAQRDGADHALWYALQVLPHPGEERRRRAPRVQQRFRHFHHDFNGLGHPFLEGRLFRDGPGVEYSAAEHGVLLPMEGLARAWKGLAEATWGETLAGRARAREGATAMGAYLHYKMTRVDPAEYVEESYASELEPGTNYSFWRRRGKWEHAAYPVGVYHNLSSLDGFYVREVPNYLRCDEFDGHLERFAWSLPAALRVDRRWALNFDADENAASD